MIVCVIPTFRATRTIVDVVRGVLPFVDHVVVVDDACPDRSGALVEAEADLKSRVTVIRHAKNLGVGGSMKTGIRHAVAQGAGVVVKIDSDGQMDPTQIPRMLEIMHANPKIGFVKGNRFIDSSIAQVMPRLRLFGNSVLSLLVRIASSYWASIDPTNGYFAVRASALRRLNLDSLADRYYFEISLLAALGMRRIAIAEVEIPAIYAGAGSSLSIWKAAIGFPPRLLRSFLKRLFWQYIVADMNVGSLLFLSGALLTVLGGTFGVFWWYESAASGIPRTAGTVVLSFAPVLMGFQLLLNAVLYDVQFGSSVLKFEAIESEELWERSRDRSRAASTTS
jgi:glycosyltransferase involved in cell wall biosynthesis